MFQLSYIAWPGIDFQLAHRFGRKLQTAALESHVLFEEVSGEHPVERICELDADALIIRSVVVEGP